MSRFVERSDHETPVRLELHRLDPHPAWAAGSRGANAALRVLMSLEAPLPPVVVRRLPAARYEILSGHPIWEAARCAGRTEIAARLDDRLDEDRTAAMLASELDANAIDEALWLSRLVQIERATGGEHGAIARTARRVGLGRSRVAHALRLLDLDDRVIDLVRRGRLSAGHARLLLRLESPARQREVAEQAVHARWTVAALDASLSRPRHRPDSAPAGPVRRTPPRPDPDVARLERECAGALGSPVTIDAERHRIVIDCGRRDVLDGVLERLTHALRDRP